MAILIPQGSNHPVSVSLSPISFYSLQKSCNSVRRWQEGAVAMVDQFCFFFFNPGDMTHELVRHFLIETGPRGVKLKGCPNEPNFGEPNLAFHYGLRSSPQGGLTQALSILLLPVLLGVALAEGRNSCCFYK